MCVWMVQLQQATPDIQIPIELHFDREILGISYLNVQPQLFEHDAVSYAGVEGISGSDQLENNATTVRALLIGRASDGGDAFRVITAC